MPKIIPELREKILDYAKNSFKESGYEGLSIRSLANSLGIATGTLYNYFPNKLSLFRSILIDSWDKTICKIEHVIQGEGGNKLEVILETLYRDVEERGAFAHTIFKSIRDKSDDEIKKFSEFSNKKALQLLLQQLKALGAPFTGDDGFRVVQLIVGSIRTFLSYPGERDEKQDIKFLYQIITMQQGDIDG